MHAGAHWKPASPGTHGVVPQQSALDAQRPPASTHAAPCAGVQRPMPVLSATQVGLFSQLPAQQSHDWLHDDVTRRQSSPAALQPIATLHKPTAQPGERTHTVGVTPAPNAPGPPQQSLSTEQTSPTTWQPLEGWQVPEQTKLAQPFEHPASTMQLEPTVGHTGPSLVATSGACTSPMDASVTTSGTSYAHPTPATTRTHRLMAG